MKSLGYYIQESILDNDKNITDRSRAMAIVQNIKRRKFKAISREDIKFLENSVAIWKPADQDDLYETIDDYLLFQGKNCSLNWIDISDITDLTDLFLDSPFNGDISKWDVSKVTSLNSTFYNSKFNGNLKDWNVSRVKNFYGVFAKSSFNNDSIKKWDVSSGEHFDYMFMGTKFNYDLSKWNIKSNATTGEMFIKCPIKKEYKPKK